MLKLKTKGKKKKNRLTAPRTKSAEDFSQTNTDVKSKIEEKQTHRKDAKNVKERSEKSRRKFTIYNRQ